ncbi:hypothetical protein VB834_15340 [Limnoraphis robusta Tam1]|uniref:DUF2971 domain-containing protein n=1 Tax=Limnoraphis robusta CCNP1315 TaxID=3110306 RepID=A0ABU5U365_9CYAN|nr:hypothetical protein [Limnoraphis robusta]MEA5498373.1 hypothetical protein [Limnoraphis robusta BA-68 BA1]MEA5521594.1 hypothetical protein [Limnoraphis robusta CCNP1315]MEA5540399.1 hypothetical protein [Limnoraphis robusta Tam1]MEA5544201.1 hypothetical protein [Limnoraphis robusta CCNP1324]
MPYTIEDWKKRVVSRSDMTSQVVHLTRSAIINGKSSPAIDVLMKILIEKKLIGSSTQSGFICGERRAVCFQETPLYSLAQNIYLEQEYRQKNPSGKVRYQGVGLTFSKPYVYRKGGRPVIYDRSEDAKKYLPPSEWWRIVRFDLGDDKTIIDWTDEREWRVPEDFIFDWEETSIILPSAIAYQEFIRRCQSMNSVNLLAKIKGIVNLGAVLF